MQNLISYKLIIKRVDSECAVEEYFYNDLQRGLDLFQLEKENPTIAALHLIDNARKIYGSWGQRVHKPLTESAVPDATYERTTSWFAKQGW